MVQYHWNASGVDAWSVEAAVTRAGSWPSKQCRTGHPCCGSFWCSPPHPSACPSWNNLSVMQLKYQQMTAKCSQPACSAIFCRLLRFHDFRRQKWTFSMTCAQGRRNEYESGGARIHPARSAGKKFFLCPPLFIQWRGTAQCNVLSLQPSTVHVDTKFVNCHTVMN